MSRFCSGRSATYVVSVQAIHGKTTYHRMVSCPRDKQRDAERLFRRRTDDTIRVVSLSRATPLQRELSKGE